MTSNPLINPLGVVFQVGVPPGDVLFLSILDDSGPYKGRSKLIAKMRQAEPRNMEAIPRRERIWTRRDCAVAGEYRRVGRYDCKLGKL